MLESDTPSKTFLGVRFSLVGFDSINEQKVRVKLIDGGGVSVDSQNCTHFIVDKLVYDDPICVAARNDGKVVVTALWVDHSFDIGMAVDATSIMYKPLRDLNGIPGAKSLIICLTGYQRQDRDDIMTMVNLMGAQFSKPLVASKVTHLICYKFEGEKYELAKKIKKIKLINHRWLEDCLREWKLLSEANYCKSGYELEMSEAEAKDSEEEAEETSLKQSRTKSMDGSPHCLKSGRSELPNLAAEVPTPTIRRQSPNTKAILLTPGKSHECSSFNDVNVPDQRARDFGLSCNATSIKLSEPHNQCPNSTTVDNNLASTSKKPSLSDEKFTSISYTRKSPRTSLGKSTSPNFSVDTSGNISGSPQVMKIKESSDISSSKTWQPEQRIDSCFVESPWKQRDLRHGEDSAGILPQKRALTPSASGSKSQKVIDNAKASLKGSLLDNEGLGPTSLVIDQLHNKDCTRDRTGYLNTVYNSCASNVTTKSLPKDITLRLTVSTEDRKNNADEKLPIFPFKGYMESTLDKSDKQLKNADDKSPKVPSRGLTELISATMPSIGDSCLVQPVVGEPEEPQSKLQDVEAPLLDDRKLEIENSCSPATLDLLEGNAKLVTKTLSKKMPAKKTLGSRQKLSNIANKKGSIFLTKIEPENDSTICSSGAKERATDKISSEFETNPSIFNMEAEKDVIQEVTKTQNAAAGKTQFMDDETEAPDEEGGNDSENAPGREKSDLVELEHNADIVVEKEHARQESKVALQGSINTLYNGTKDSDPERVVGNNNSELGESASKSHGLKKKSNKRKKAHAGKTQLKTIPSESKNDLVDQDTCGGKNVDKKDDEKENFVPHPLVKTNRSNASSKVKNSVVAKQSNPVVCKEIAGKSVKSTKKAMKTNESSQKVDSNTKPVQKVLNISKIEPVCFIFSGHRLQRKEFQQVIRRLKGKFCRDSHQWSYQATHFVAPDPIRRTEKFFAAASSGRWILKTDYLSACCQAGKFLAEEPYEWHKNGLSEDGAINLEAPRKWRHLRERTGRGAFFGMRIVLYGECIAPPLDTLKRVVKAGDGTILATSPPYTKFLKSGVDYAVVSPGMPRADLWVQEFLKHEIPCVVADYLVEFVCKPGYSLEKHVLYNTQEWAEKSFTNLMKQAEKVVDDSSPQTPDDSETGSEINEIRCQVCGSAEKGEVMLICGDESGCVGCGVGTHIDCCDPPLEDVPEEDWFCPNCSKSTDNPSPSNSKKKKKGNSRSKSK